MIVLHGKNGTVELQDITIRALKKAWPTKDVDTELAKMHLWLLQHPTRRPVYFWLFLRNWLRKAPDILPAPPPPHPNWWKSAEGTLAIGKGLGLEPRPGEEMAQYRARVSDKLAEGRRH